MTSTREYVKPLPSHETAATHQGLREWFANLPAVLFNTGFAIVAIVTLCGIVFVTRPKVVLHDIQPWMWLPLLAIMAPAQMYAQFLSWSAIFSRKAPTGPRIAMYQRKIPAPLRLPVAGLWLCNFIIGCGIVVSLSKPHGGNPAPPTAFIGVVAVLAFLFTFAANIYLLLAIRTLTPNENLLHRVWKRRFWIDLAIAVFAVIYYHV